MDKERTFEITKKKKPRISGFIHIGEVIPGVLGDIERRIKESHKKIKKTSLGIEVEERRE